MEIGDIDDTIAAVSSPPGPSIRAVIRISGPSAGAIAKRIISPAPDAARPGDPSAISRVRLAVEPGWDVPAIAYYFYKPRSYTGQDVVEFHLPGGPVLVRMTLDALLRSGARAAGPGEFSARAYLNGKMDLTQAEGVAQIIAAESDRQLQAAKALMTGRLSSITQHLQAKLAELLALVEAGIDFVEEDIEFIESSEAASQIRSVRSRLADLLASGVEQERIEWLPKVLLLGLPNAGKSTLMNRLCGMDRSICSPLAGTTRDVLAAPLRLEHGECLLLDAAGLEDEPGGTAETAAVEAARRAADDADAAVLVVDSTIPPPSIAWPKSPDIVVLGKCDLLPPPDLADALGRARNLWERRALAVSGLRGDGVPELITVLDKHLFGTGDIIRGDALALSARHREAINHAIESLDSAGRLANAGEPGELLALELREAIDQLAALAGDVATEDILGTIFSRFCIGK
jgi:tRNA modification GTPase